MKSRSNTMDVYHRYYLNREKLDQVKAEIISSTTKSSKHLFSQQYTMEDSNRKKSRILSINKIVSRVPSSMYKNYFSGGKEDILSPIVRVRKTSLLKKNTKWSIECETPIQREKVKCLANFSTVREGVICLTCEADRGNRTRLFKRRK